MGQPSLWPRPAESSTWDWGAGRGGGLWDELWPELALWPKVRWAPRRVELVQNLTSLQRSMHHAFWLNPSLPRVPLYVIVSSLGLP